MHSYLWIILAATSLAAADWPQWRGPNRDGKSAETGLMAAWPAGGPPRVWTATGLGEGYSSVAIAGGRIYTQGQRGSSQYILACDAATGKKLWELSNGGRYHERRGHGPRGVPTVDGDRLYALAADGTLSAVDVKSGQRVWSVSFTRDFGGEIPNWGYSESPLVDGNRVIVTPGGRQAGVVALDKLSGKPIWKTQSDGAGYSSPVITPAGSGRVLLVLTDQAALVLRADNGELLSRHSNVSNRVANIATPIAHSGRAFFSTDYGTGATLLKLAPNGAASEVYFSREMKNHYGSSVLVGEHLYGYNSNILTAMRFDTGEVAWRNRSVGKGSCIYAEKNLYCLGEDGVVGLVEATPEAYKEKSRFSFNKGSFPSWSPLAIANGHLYLRDQDFLYSFDIRAKR
ncbi:MAG: PQQ-binding-like beta-propeller repeat protein [Bryobacteraceae bacterium]